jgi:hypothetical protein
MSNKTMTDVIVARKARTSNASQYEGGGLFDYFKSKPLPQPTFDEKDKYTLSNRILTYRFIKSYLDYHLKPNDCLTEKKFGDKVGYTIRDIVDLVEEFGTPSSTPTKTKIYATILNIANAGKILIVSKVRKGFFNFIDEETKIMSLITEKLIDTALSKHFVIMYKSILCVNGKIETVDFNEHFDGDVKMLLKKDDVKGDRDTLFNIQFQCFISLATFNNMIGYTHTDAHGGNFLYQENKEVGYYHYSFGGKSFYLKSCRYNICLYDFGEVIQSINNFKIYEAMLRIIAEEKVLRQIIDNEINLPRQLGEYYTKNLKNPIFKTLFFEEILRLMKEHSPKGMIVDKLDDGTVALNEKPFIISNHKAIGGSRGIVVKYKSTGEHVHIVYNNKKLKRCVYTKTKGRGKYCKINKIYILLSKLKLVDE